MQRCINGLLAYLLATLACVVGINAQEKEEVLDVRTRVVFIDTLVKDKKTNNPVTELKPENFQVLADGRPREISYFRTEGDADRRPLALVLVLDLREGGAGRFLQRQEILDGMVAELSKLSPADEVAVLAIKLGGKHEREWLTSLTHDRAQIAAALSRVPTIVRSEQNRADEEQLTATGEPVSASGESRTQSDETKHADDAASQIGDAQQSETSVATSSATTKATRKDIVEEASFTGKDGSLVTRTTYKDGTVRVKRISHNGNVTIELGDSVIMGATSDTAQIAIKERPNSRTAIIWVSDGIAPIFYVERDAATEMSTKSNVMFNALVTDMKFGFKLFKPVLKPLGDVVGLNVYGATQNIAKQTGGEALRVRRPSDYANGLREIIGNLKSRYSLGFTLAENELDDGKLHPLEVRVKAKDAKGKTRKLEVSARQGFFMPKGSNDKQIDAGTATESSAKQN